MMKNNINKIPVRKKVETMHEDTDMEEVIPVDEKAESGESSPVKEYFDSLTDEEKQELISIVDEYKKTNETESEEEIDMNELTKESPESTED